MNTVSRLESEFWSKWQMVNGHHIAPAYGRAWTEVQKQIYIQTPQARCRQWFDGERRHFLAEREAQQ